MKNIRSGKLVKLKSSFAILTSFALLLSGCTSNAKNKDEKDQDVVLSAFVQQSLSTDSGIWKGWAAQKLYNDMNIKIDFYATGGNQVEQKLKQYISSGTLPDIVGFKALDQAQLAMDAGLLLPLDDYREKLPSIFESSYYEKAIAYSKEHNSDKSKKLFIMPTSIGPVSDNAYNWMPLLQWDAYKKAGTPDIDTLEDYLSVVEKMVKEKPSNESGESTYGFSLFSDWDKYSALEVAALSYFYGIDTEYVCPLMETNVITRETHSILNQDSFYKRALHFYFSANQKGLLDPDSRTQSFSNLEKKYSDGRIMFSWFSWLTGNYNDASSGHVNNKKSPDGYANILANDMKIYEAPDQTIGRNWYFSISKNCKNIDKACEFLNWLYDPQVEHFLYNGPKDSIWEYSKDGEPYVTKEGWDVIEHKTEKTMPVEGGGVYQDGIYPFNAIALQASTVMEDNYTISYRYWPSSRKHNMTNLQKEVNEKLNSDTIGEYLYDHDMVAKSTMAVNMIPVASNEMKLKIESIGEVVRNLSWEMIYAENEETFEQLWEEMVVNGKELGMDQVEQYYQKEWKDSLNKVEKYE
ncbi:extracellular solute-binding protein [Blautia liquoris]|uniref:Extracellular solute-binding protein n=1 Tax=Blautia liquoris TaxID=2779518 RepID=A0A7M2RJD9_9FIRM|nr:extracellular solute-binding protein [Blautia liquoris]QOV20248.1 extracellular solute-binding protein [Blautia liquoris]